MLLKNAVEIQELRQEKMRLEEKVKALEKANFLLKLLGTFHEHFII